MVNRCSLCKDSKESEDHNLIHCGKTRALDFAAIIFWTGVGVLGFSEKSSLGMEN